MNTKQKYKFNKYFRFKFNFAFSIRYFKILGCFIFILNCKAEDEINLTQNETVEIEFIKNLGGSLNDAAYSVVATPDGGFGVFGYTQSNDFDITGKTDTSFDYWLLKFDAIGNLLWQKTFGGSLQDKGSDIVNTLDGGFAVVGQSNSNDGDANTSFGSNDFWVLKLDINGNLQWQKTLGYSGNDYGISILQSSNGDFLISGVLDVTASGGLGNRPHHQQNRHAGGDYWLIKLDQNGNELWKNYYGGNNTDTPYGLVEANNGGYIVAGSSDSNDSDIQNNIGTYDFWVIKVSETGNLDWERSFGGSQIDEAFSIIKHNNNYLITGSARSNDANVDINKGASDTWLIEISDTGQILRQSSFGDIGFDSSKAIVKTTDNNLLFAGNSRSDTNGFINNGQNDAWIFKSTANGEIIWQQFAGGSAIDLLYDIVELNDGSYIAVGESSSNDNSFTNKGFSDMLIIKVKKL